MANKKTNHGESKTQVKNNVQKPKKNGRGHQRGEIISKDELEERGGLTGDATALLTVYLQKFEENRQRRMRETEDVDELIKIMSGFYD